MASRPPKPGGIWLWIALLLMIIILVNNIPAFSHYSMRPIHSHTRSIRQRIALSDESFQRSVTERHQMRAGHKTPDSIPFFPAQKLDDVAQTPYTIWDFFPPAWTCPWDMQRVGQLGDGGKWVCGMSLYEEQTDPPTVMYSFGVNNRSTFEAEMLVRSNVEIFAFDHSTEGLEAPLTAEQRSRVQFMKLVLGGEDQLQREPPIYTLNTLMQLHEHEYIDILKIDIEGAEYAALDAVMNEFQGRPLPLGQVIISMHLEDKTDITFPRFYEWWERLESYGMRATSFEVDLLAITTSAQKRNPDRVEYVWVNTQDPQSILLREL